MWARAFRSNKREIETVERGRVSGHDRVPLGRRALSGEPLDGGVTLLVEALDVGKVSGPQQRLSAGRCAVSHADLVIHKRGVDLAPHVKARELGKRADEP